MATRTVETRLSIRDEMSPALARASQNAENLSRSTERAGKTADAAAGRWRTLGDSATKTGTRAADAADKASTAAGRYGKALTAIKPPDLGGVAASFDKVGRAADDARGKWEQFGRAGRAAAGAGVVIGAGFGAAVKQVSDFETAMSGVSAATMAGASDMARLRQAAIDLGADSQYSAQEAAQGITELAKAGVSTADILRGGLAGALNLAAAGQLEVAEAAEISSAALVQFKLSGADVGHVADLLAAGAGKAMGSVHDLGGALNQAGLVASSTGLSIEETVGGLAAFASAGMVGSDAGTSFKTMLQRLTPQSAEAAKTMDALGISAYDQQGNFVGLSAFAGQLQTSMQGLTAEQRNAAMSTMFGSDAVRAANVLYTEGAAGIEQWIDRVDDQGFAAEQAARLTNNLAGDMERLGGAFDSVVMKSGSGVNTLLRDLVQGATSAVEAVGSLPTPVLEAGAGLVGLSGAALVLGGGFVTLVPQIAATKAVLTGLSAQAAASTGALSLMGVAVRGLGVGAAVAGLVVLDRTISGLVYSATSITPEANALADSLTRVGQGVESGQAFLDLFTTKLGPIQVGAQTTADALRIFGETAKGALDPTVWDRVKFAEHSAQVNMFEGSVKQMDAALAQMVQSGNAQGAQASWNQLAAAAEAEGVSVDRLREKFPLYDAALSANADATARATQERIRAKAAAEGITEAEAAYALQTEDAAKATDQFTKALQSLGAGLLGERASLRAFEEAIDKVDGAVKENGKTLDVHTAKGRANQDILDGIASSGAEAAAKIYASSGSIEEAAAQVNKTRGAFVEAAVKMGMGREAAEQLATQLGLTTEDVVALARQIKNLPDQKTTKIDADTSQASAALQGVLGKLNDLERRSFTAMVRVATSGPIGMLGMNPVGRATGGAVFGAGTATSDSIPAMLSNGEHVLTAREVAAAGGHGAVYRLRRALLAGTVEGYKTGGRVGMRDAYALAAPGPVLTEAPAAVVLDVMVEVRE